MSSFQSSFEEYLALLLKSGLATRDWLGAIVEQFAASRGTHGRHRDAGTFARWLIEQGHLTPWQHRRLLDGKTQGFFLGKYKILSHLGSGGMSEVYLGEHTMLRRRVAIKVLAIDKISSDSSVLQRFLTEAQAIASLDHKNIVRAYNVDKRGRVYYIAMEYVAGEDLQRAVEREGPLSFASAIAYTSQAAEGLAHAHAKGFVHRDVKPANLLVDAHGTVKLLDLGLAKLRRAQGRSLTMEYNDRILGTVDYMAPEQALNSHKVDGLADVYGLGCTLYFLLSGRPPFPTGTIAQRMVQHLHGNRPSLFDVRPDAPPELVRICHRMMARNARDRIPTSEIGAALRTVLAELPKDGLTTSPKHSWAPVDVGADTKISQAPAKPNDEPGRTKEQEELDEVSSLLAAMEDDREPTNVQELTKALMGSDDSTVVDADFSASIAPSPDAPSNPPPSPVPAPAVRSSPAPRQTSAAPVSKVVSRMSPAPAAGSSPGGVSSTERATNKVSTPAPASQATAQHDAVEAANDAAERSAGARKKKGAMFWRGHPVGDESEPNG